MPEIDEQLDLVDGNDVKIGVIGRSQVHTLRDGGGRYLRTACAFIRNRDGKYWIPLRVADKTIAPNGLDFAMAEHMGVGESYLDAAIRGFQEELGIAVNPNDLRLAGILGPVSKLPYFTAIYLYESDKEPDYNTEDYQSGRWLAPQEVITAIEAGAAAKGQLAQALKLILVQEGHL